MRHGTLSVRAIALCLVLMSSSYTMAQTKRLRFPDIHGSQVIFTRFSPAGGWIAFTGQYDGDEQVYIVPTGDVDFA